ncbi:MAG: hypothetical protein H6868_05700 [Rhodospirillales bacterium]|nr:hypothetical protein [Rhodospirillales bacterium]
MSREYVEERIRAALKATKGHPLKAQQRIIAEVAQDHRLLLGLTQGHLTGIVALWVNRILSRPQRDAADAPPPAAPKSLDMAPETFGKEILQALQGKATPQFGQESYAARPGHKQASQAHINAIKSMARRVNKDGDKH